MIVLLAISTGITASLAVYLFVLLAREWSCPPELPRLKGARAVRGPESLSSPVPSLPNFTRCDKWARIANGGSVKFR